MGRIRMVKPEFFTDEDLFDLDFKQAEAGASTLGQVRLAYAGLWTQADREGRFRWKPRTLKAAILPHDEVDFSRLLDALATRQFIVRYEADGEVYGFIPTFLKHQYVNHRETASILPPPSSNNLQQPDLAPLFTGAPRVPDASPTGAPRVPDASPTGAPRVSLSKVKESKVKESNSSMHASLTRHPRVKVFIELPLVTGGVHAVSVEDVQHWQQLYPAVDVEQALRKMQGWLESNPRNRKTPAGIARFITNWLSGDQDKAPRASATNTANGNGKAITKDATGIIADRQQRRSQSSGPQPASGQRPMPKPV